MGPLITHPAALPQVSEHPSSLCAPILSYAFGGLGPQGDSPAPTSERTAEHQGSSQKKPSCPGCASVTEWVGRRDVEQPAPLTGPEQPIQGSPGLCRLPQSFHGTSLVAQMVKNLLTRQETWARSLGRGDPLEKEMATYSSILA